MIAFLHTSEVHIDKFEGLVRKFNSTIPTQHFVNKELLDIALANGQTDAQLFANQVAEIKAQQPDLIICTCSTLGTECDKDPNIHRIDQPIAEYIVQHYDQIGLAFTATSTQKTSENLLLQTSLRMGKPINIIPIDGSIYWPFFEQGNMPAYEQGIAETIQKSASEVEAVFLAQASMEGAKKYLQNLGKEVLTSPAYGVKAFMDQEF